MLSWLNAKIFPLCIAHQTFVVMALYYVLPLDLPLMSKLALVVTITTFWSLAFATAAECLPAPIRIFVGLPCRKKAPPAPATRRSVVTQTPEVLEARATEKRPTAGAEN